MATVVTRAGKGINLTPTEADANLTNINAELIAATSGVAANASAISGKQSALISATNIKTVNGTSILGSGDIAISGAGLDANGVRAVPATGVDFTDLTAPTATSTILQFLGKLWGNVLANATAIATKDATGGYVGLTLYKINFKNALNTITSFFTNANTVARTYTFPDKDGTVAMISDITGSSVAGFSESYGSKGIREYPAFYKNSVSWNAQYLRSEISQLQYSLNGGGYTTPSFPVVFPANASVNYKIVLVNDVNDLTAFLLEFTNV